MKIEFVQEENYLKESLAKDSSVRLNLHLLLSKSSVQSTIVTKIRYAIGIVFLNCRDLKPENFMFESDKPDS